eukprot:CAMPEP_0177401312 /NCGR_PEP_ID=MMETSP0368-20130122/59577_1 /TAXON_ID=447022 ORGANISM="Scrippsiella hangoei-like, Strain SHHI-4" /NCGR_SAMPLE_ID=MMETSP0368 /ASSEMBLY_ACC=CAM_ASM_000363 /LENGTH=183 /DNA_ID=CAMNT_0018868873 /DNA_START=434 /DNA_END=983 /DNA_ORIENTATION=+
MSRWLQPSAPAHNGTVLLKRGAGCETGLYDMHDFHEAPPAKFCMPVEVSGCCLPPEVREHVVRQLEWRYSDAAASIASMLEAIHESFEDDDDEEERDGGQRGRPVDARHCEPVGAQGCSVKAWAPSVGSGGVLQDSGRVRRCIRDSVVREVTYLADGQSQSRFLAREAFKRPPLGHTKTRWPS